VVLAWSRALVVVVVVRRGLGVSWGGGLAGSPYTALTRIRNYSPNVAENSKIQHAPISPNRLAHP
jgi:hypothetical protein